MKLDIVIPAYNEEQAIESIVVRCLDARETIISQTPVDQVSITVVSDGSWDRTLELARQFEPLIKVIAFEKNRGYGAAIKAGFAAGDGELVSFLDADGTCDPNFFAPIINELLDQDASVALGSRMGPQSQMPAIRRLGNRIWRTIINWMAKVNISDAASGMRVIRRRDLKLLEPLPDGLHYTPTMSCRAVLDARLSIVEVFMPYKERTGRSKLNVVIDGLRFLKTIINVGLTYQPFRLISVPGLGLLVLAGLVLLPVPISYFHTVKIEDWYIYRILFGMVMASGGLQMFVLGLAGERAVELAKPKKWPGGPLLALLKRNLTPRVYLAAAGVCLLIALGLNVSGLWTYVTTGHVYEHWSRAAVGALFAVACLNFLAGAVLDQSLRLLVGQQRSGN